MHISNDSKIAAKCNAMARIGLPTPMMWVLSLYYRQGGLMFYRIMHVRVVEIVCWTSHQTRVLIGQTGANLGSDWLRENKMAHTCGRMVAWRGPSEVSQSGADRARVNISVNPALTQQPRSVLQVTTQCSSLLGAKVVLFYSIIKTQWTVHGERR